MIKSTFFTLYKGEKNKIKQELINKEYKYNKEDSEQIVSGMGHDLVAIRCNAHTRTVT